MTKKVVAKFGGTSVADSEAIGRSVRIVASLAKSANVIVVLSASSGMTNLLLELARNSVDPDNTAAAALLNRIAEHHRQTCNVLIESAEQCEQLLARINTLLDELRLLSKGIHLLRECTSQSVDAVVSYGELLNSTLFAYALHAAGVDNNWFDARSVIVTDSSFQAGLVDWKQTQSHADMIFNDSTFNVHVTQGFIGADQIGRTTTLGRGGSDYSAAIFGVLWHADEIQIWTDVSGFYTADPRLIASAKPLATMTYDEAYDLANFGAKVLHPATVKPAISAGIPVKILNTFQPTDSGTLLVASLPKPYNRVIAVSMLTQCFMAAEFSTEQQSDSELKQPFISVDVYGQAVCIFKKKPASASTTCDVVGVVYSGAEEHRPEAFATLCNVLVDKQYIAALYGAAKSCFVYVVPEGRGQQFVIDVHEALIAPNREK